MGKNHVHTLFENDIFKYYDPVLVLNICCEYLLLYFFHYSYFTRKQKLRYISRTTGNKVFGIWSLKMYQLVKNSIREFWLAIVLEFIIGCYSYFNFLVFLSNFAYCLYILGTLLVTLCYLRGICFISCMLSMRIDYRRWISNNVLIVTFHCPLWWLRTLQANFEASERSLR